MGELMRQGKVVYHATGSSAFTNTLRKIVGRRASNLFKFFFNFTKHKENEIDVLICDEAHRIRSDSNDYGVPSQFKSKIHQKTMTSENLSSLRAALNLVIKKNDSEKSMKKDIPEKTKVDSTDVKQDLVMKTSGEVGEDDLKKTLGI